MSKSLKAELELWCSLTSARRWVWKPTMSNVHFCSSQKEIPGPLPASCPRPFTETWIKPGLSSLVKSITRWVCSAVADKQRAGSWVTAAASWCLHFWSRYAVPEPDAPPPGSAAMSGAPNLGPSNPRSRLPVGEKCTLWACVKQKVQRERIYYKIFQHVNG